MIDTVKLKLYGVPFRPATAGWEKENGTKTNADGDTNTWIKYQHRESGLRLYGPDGRATSMEVSLPRLLNGCNGILLRPDQVNEAYVKALDVSSNVLEGFDCVDLEKLTRLDLVHHFEGWAFDFVCALRGLKHKGVRNKQVEWFESGLEWPGRNLYIRLYDKKLELSGRPGRVQRLEAQLRGKKLPDVWSSSGGFNVELCYEQYRTICRGFSSRVIPNLGTLAELLHWLKSKEVTVDGICPVERFLSCKSERQRRRLRKALNDVSLQFFEACFIDHLPEKIHDLNFIDCLPDKQPEAALARSGVQAAA
jgi:hypothetical protein